MSKCRGSDKGGLGKVGLITLDDFLTKEKEIKKQQCTTADKKKS